MKEEGKPLWIGVTGRRRVLMEQEEQVVPQNKHLHVGVDLG